MQNCLPVCVRMYVYTDAGQKKGWHRNMKSVYIKLNEINDVYALVNTLVSYDGEVDLESGRYKVDGKSLLGIFSLDLRKPVKLTFHDSEKAEALMNDMKRFIVEDPEQ
jgi:phosphocarrier protein HPr